MTMHVADADVSDAAAGSSSEQQQIGARGTKLGISLPLESLSPAKEFKAMGPAALLAAMQNPRLQADADRTRAACKQLRVLSLDDEKAEQCSDLGVCDVLNFTMFKHARQPLLHLQALATLVNVCTGSPTTDAAALERRRALAAKSGVLSSVITQMAVHSDDVALLELGSIASACLRLKAAPPSPTSARLCAHVRACAPACARAAARSRLCVSPPARPPSRPSSSPPCPSRAADAHARARIGSRCGLPGLRRCGTRAAGPRHLARRAQGAHTGRHQAGASADERLAQSRGRWARSLTLLDSP